MYNFFAYFDIIFHYFKLAINFILGEQRGLLLQYNYFIRFYIYFILFLN